MLFHAPGCGSRVVGAALTANFDQFCRFDLLT
jgi:hypothetical protein